MFLGRRCLQAEYFDQPDRTREQVAEGYRLLGRVNRLFRNARPFQRIVPRLLGEEACRSLSLLDVGAGDGSLGLELRAWAATRGWDWRITCSDRNPEALAVSGSDTGGGRVVAVAEALPFADAAFDVVIAAQMTHHIDSEEGVCRHFGEAWRVARRAVVIHDIHRNAALYGVLGLVLLGMRMPAHFRSDGLLSVRRGWRVPEWRRLAATAGMSGARVWLEGGARLTLEAVKPGPGAGAVPATTNGTSGGCR